MPQGMVLDVDVDTAASPRRSRRGSETRQRTEQVKMRFLPDERDNIKERARQVGITGPGYAQRYMRYLLGFEPAPAQ
ncbi:MULTISPECIES: plasmid mobilization protein [Mycolicibacterium]|uniref:plasmid mobilization protein n=1 Tax=Mycolicibacterium TaxID=1866885 RepID=UPI001CDCC9E4|nr:hypothetical protein [Mycolicibacterium fortuitum]UBV21689.1 hypothetical protein H8Z59_00065 [Mycolicibacterium fortuitum]